MASSLRLRNPHSVLAVIDRRPQDVYEIVASDQDLSNTWKDVQVRAESMGIPVSAQGKPSPKPGGKQRRHAGAEAVVAKESESEPGAPQPRGKGQGGDPKEGARKSEQGWPGRFVVW